MRLVAELHAGEGEMAEAVRFELTDGFPSPVFKTGAIDHSATLPGVLVAAGDSKSAARFQAACRWNAGRRWPTVAPRALSMSLARQGASIARRASSSQPS